MNVKKLCLKIGCSNAVKLAYDCKTKLFTGYTDLECEKGFSFGILNIKEFSELLLLISRHGWRISDEQVEDCVMFIK